MAGAAALAAETRKLCYNIVQKCLALGWTCIPVAVETYGSWGKEAQAMFLRLSSHLAISMSSPKPTVWADIYGRLNIILVRSMPEPSWQGNLVLHDFVLILVLPCI